jgi:hypothetical protein
MVDLQYLVRQDWRFLGWRGLALLALLCVALRCRSIEGCLGQGLRWVRVVEVVLGGGSAVI